MTVLNRERSPPSPVAASVFNSRPGKRVHVVQGEFHVTDEPDAVLVTLLGSCVAACLRDPLAGVGGINHFLLPGREGSDTLRYGVHAMELLVNGLLQRGARRERLEAKLFGGAQLMDGLADIGGMNAAFAEQFLRKEHISMVGGSLRGARGRRIEYWPGSGRARQIFLERDVATVFAAERRAPAPAPDDGAVELF